MNVQNDNKRHAEIVGVGAYLPKKIVTNDDLSKKIETSDEWIRTRTGISQRHIASPDETCVLMGSKAALEAMKQAGVSADEVDGIIVATSTPDQVFPSVAVGIERQLGIKTFGFDLSAACSGFIYALSVGNAFILSGQARCLLVIGVEVFSRLLDWDERSTCVLFGDGAGAVVLKENNHDAGIISTHLHSDPELGDILYVDGSVGNKCNEAVIKMNGREVFRHAVSRLAESVDEALKENNLKAEDIDYLVPHQANYRIISGLAKKLNLSEDQVIITVDKHANTSAASIPLALYEAVKTNRIKKGDLILMEALGGGLTWGSVLVKY